MVDKIIKNSTPGSLKYAKKGFYLNDWQNYFIAENCGSNGAAVRSLKTGTLLMRVSRE
jgi:hypothetical protein